MTSGVQERGRNNRMFHGIVSRAAPLQSTYNNMYTHLFRINNNVSAKVEEGKEREMDGDREETRDRFLNSI